MQKINMKFYSAHARIISLSLTLIGYLFIGGCLYLPWPSYHWDADGEKVKPASIVSGETTRETVLEKLGRPVAQSADGRYFLHRYWRQRRAILILGDTVETIDYCEREVVMLIEYDNSDIVKRTRTHTCETETFDFVCDFEVDSALSLCEMLKELKDDNLLATYC